MNGEKPPEKIEICFPQSMEEAIDGAVVRLGGLFPKIHFSAADCTITAESIEGIDHHQVKQELFNAVYREAILLRTNDIRAKIIG